MRHLLRRHPFAIAAHFDFTLTLTFSVPAEKLRPLLYPGLELDTLGDETGFVAVAMVQTRDLRPEWMPAFCGRDFFLTGYRIFVRRRMANGRNVRGLQVLRSDTDRRMMCVLGNVMTHYRYHHAAIEVGEDGADLRIKVRSDDGRSDLDVRAFRDRDGLPAGSVFRDEKTARRFAGPMPFTFSYEPTTGNLLKVEGQRTNWHPRLVQVEAGRVDFLRHLDLDRDARLANAFLIEDVSYRWNCGEVEPAVDATRRSRCEGVGNIARFNWPAYTAAVGTVVVGGTVAASRRVPFALRVLGGLAAMGSLWQAGVSLAASHWVYDRSGLYSLDWLNGLWPENPDCIVNVHAGFDETTDRLRTLYPAAEVRVLDFFDPARNSEPSIRRARKANPPRPGTRSVGCEGWPIQDSEADAVLVFLAAHEMRAPEDRRRLFAELRRICSPGGRIVLVEHLRDAANFVAFGPGFVHFMPRHVWVNETEGWLRLLSERAFTPLLRVFCFEPKE